MLKTIDVTLRESVYTKMSFSYELALDYINQIDTIPFLNTIELGYADAIGNLSTVSNYNADYIKEARLVTNKNLSIMFRLNNFLENKKVWNHARWDDIDMVRIMTNKDLSLLKEVVNYFHDKGIIVSVNPSYISRMNDGEIKYLLEYVTESGADIFYIADTNGSMFEDNLEKIYQLIQKECGDTVKIGFHAHNHYHLAAANAYYLMKRGVQFMDGTISGFGKGAGNLPLELIPVFAEKLQQYTITKEDFLTFNMVAKYFDSILKGQIASYDSFINLLYAYRNMKLSDFNTLLYNNDIEDIGEKLIYYD